MRFDSSALTILIAISAEIAHQVVPPAIQKASDFIRMMEQILGVLKKRMKLNYVIQDSPRTFIDEIYRLTGMNEHTLKFFSRRLNSLILTLNLPQIHRFLPIGRVCFMLSTMAMYVHEGFVVLFEPEDPMSPLVSYPTLLLSCMDASIVMKPICLKYNRIVLTSGTISPLDMLPKILGVKADYSISLEMSLSRTSICPMIISRGDDQTEISTKFGLRDNSDIIRNYAQLLLSMTTHVPDGIVCFFPSYHYMETIISAWNELGWISKFMSEKLLFFETEDRLETEIAVVNYKRACDVGRGAILLSVARGKVSEGIDFEHHYGRCVILFGIPFQYTESRSLKAKLAFLKEKHKIQENDFLSFDAMRMAAQCVGRVIRGKSDYGIMIFADKRYNRVDKRGKLPKWIHQFITEERLNISTYEAMHHAKTFLKEMSMPMDRVSICSRIQVNLKTYLFRIHK